ncbi:MAG: hypothetical protein LWW78_03700 [Deltaproteobacteria bacterium]|nr:hypothetical protein [Deltaproteobacteria bacterium]
MRNLLKSINWKTFLIGVICGVLISLSLIYFIGNRYVIVTAGSDWVLRLDKWTGKTWVLLLGWGWGEGKEQHWEVIWEQEKEPLLVGRIGKEKSIDHKLIEEVVAEIVAEKARQGKGLATGKAAKLYVEQKKKKELKLK